MARISVGREYRFTPSAFSGEKVGRLGGRDTIRELVGIIIYVNEAHRMFTVAAPLPSGGVINESFKY